ncbi:MAG: SdpI family protein [Kangiellaceae bacterium]|nr:SdpI family protein [Kangiellaceae bacterium]
MYFTLVMLLGLVFYYLALTMGNESFKPSNSKQGIRTPETLGDPEIWRKVNKRAAKYYKQIAYAYFIIAILTIALVRGVMAVFVFVAIIALMGVLLWRNGQLQDYAKQLHEEKEQEKQKDSAKLLGKDQDGQ